MPSTRLNRRRIIQMTHGYDIRAINPPWSFHPWIGNRYLYRALHGLNILVVGESFYGTGYEIIAMDCVARFGIEYPNEGPHFYPKIAKLLLGRGAGSQLSYDMRKHFWHSIAFCNYLQECLPNPRERPTSAQWAAAEAPFRAILRELQPDLIVAIGKEVFDHLPKAPDGIPCCWSYHFASRGKFSYSGESPKILNGVNEAREQLGLPALGSLFLLEEADEEESEESELLGAVNEARKGLGLPPLESIRIENKYPHLDVMLDAVNAERRKSELPELSYRELQEVVAQNAGLLAAVNEVREQLGLSPLLSVFV